MRYPSGPIKFVGIVYNNLTEKLKELNKYKKKVISHINIARAFELFSNKNFAVSLRYLLKGILSTPSLKFLLKTWFYYT